MVVYLGGLFRNDIWQVDTMSYVNSRHLSTIFYLLFTLTPVSAQTSTIQIVTSFTILEDLTRELGGQHVNIINLVPRNSDAHMYQPKPSDSVAIAKADLVIFNGLGFEGWIDRLVREADKENRQLVASDGVNVKMLDDETDPHAWQSFENVRIYVENITGTLIMLLPHYKDDFIRRKDEYLTELSDLESRLHERLAKIPETDRIVVTSHDAFGYLGDEFDIQFLSPLGLSLDSEASASDIASVIDQIRDQNVTALFVENINDPRLLKSIASESAVTIGGRLYSDALSEIDGPAATYLDMMRHNIGSLADAFNSSRHQL